MALLLGCQVSNDGLADRLTDSLRVDQTVPTNEPDLVCHQIVSVAGRDDLAVGICELDGLQRGEAFLVERDTLNILRRFGGGQAEYVDAVTTRRVKTGTLIKAYITATIGDDPRGIEQIVIHEDNTIEEMPFAPFGSGTP